MLDIVVYHILKWSSKKTIQENILWILKITFKLKNLISLWQLNEIETEKINDIIDRKLNDVYNLTLLLKNYNSYIY